MNNKPQPELPRLTRLGILALFTFPVFPFAPLYIYFDVLTWHQVKSFIISRTCMLAVLYFLFSP